MAVKWTEEQQKVIDTRDQNMLVSAAAGSGKTAVLVERIISRIISKENPLDVDKILVVTFTEAAAAEMKGRIRDAIEKKAEKEPDNEHIQKQASLIHSAKITTIHSFCLSVIREHFYTIDLDPGFRTAEEGELKLLRQDAAEELLEENYEKGEGEFFDFVEWFSNEKNEKMLEEKIIQIYDFSRSAPDPKRWLEACLRSYSIESEEEFEQFAFTKNILSDIRRNVKDGIEILQKGIEICRQEDGPWKYQDTLESDILQMVILYECTSFSELMEKLEIVEWAGLKSITKKDKENGISEEKTIAVKAIRDKNKKCIEEIRKTYAGKSIQEYIEDLKRCYPVVRTLIHLVLDFEKKFSEKKRARGVIDFDDMEHLALKILTQKVDGELVPSEVAKEYQLRLDEIMIDEYQDSNMLQETILNSVSSVQRGKYNLFMVGDVKQSIYSFRLAKPELFMEKFAEYPGKENCCRIDLHKNFRSRSEVLDGVNFIFEQIMTSELGGICYDATAKLNVGATFEPQDGNEIEVIVLHTENSEELPEESSAIETEGEPKRKTEARVVAKRIKKLMETQKVFDGETQEYRSIQYKDIVILLRTMSGWSDVFGEVLNNEGIPTYVGSKEGYFETLEIRTLLSYLQVLDNQNQDVPLTAVLKSAFGRVTNEELATIRYEYPESSFHEAVVLYGKGGKEDTLRVKIENILEELESYRRMLPYTAIHTLLWKIVSETGYSEYMEALPGGVRRKANIDMLIEKAIAYEATSYKGLYHFVRYIEYLKKYEVDYGEANLSDEQSDVVRLMSIHKSKGLEFPVVIVAGMGKQFNTQDMKKDIVIQSELGIGVPSIDLKKRTKSETLIRSGIRSKLKLEGLSEELRVLYVALTRAKEKLIMVGDVKGWDKKVQDYSFMSANQDTLSYTRLTGAQTYFDWVLPAVLVKENDIKIWHTYPEDLEGEDIAEELGNEFDLSILRQWDTSVVYDKEFKENLEQQFSYHYPYSNEKQLKLKYSVSELKQLGGAPEEIGEILFEEEDVIPLLPKFLAKEEEMKGASRGSAYHKLLELLDFKEDYDDQTLEKRIVTFIEEGKLSKEMAQCISRTDILRFLESSLAKRMKEAACQDKLYKEQPFVIGMEEGYLVQGIIDVYFEEEDGLVIADYKTDNVRVGSELREKYHVQLDYYEQAIARLTKRIVKEKIIYSFAVAEEIEV
ncbi:helicase-exonuclease AddAB subunit AddA [Lachnospiraceae bacterium OttesenSCG-928-E19]|nr:helicase-exonuclease AddAB subunit AddA [Lachnospiraceae bacterium OttesenSCG-928-E19]